MWCTTGRRRWISPNATRRSRSGRRETRGDVHDERADMGCDGAADSRTDRVSPRPAGHDGGDGCDRRLLKAVLLPEGRHVAGDAGQCPAGAEHHGRKTDVSDAAWLAQLVARGLLRASFAPPEPVRQLRDLIRARASACEHSLGGV